MEDSSDTQSSTDESMPDDTFSTQENTVDSTVNTEQQGEIFFLFFFKKKSELHLNFSLPYLLQTVKWTAVIVSLQI